MVSSSQLKPFTDQYSTITYNRLYDGVSGEVILTESHDEHRQNEFQFNLPSHIGYRGNIEWGQLINE